MTWEHDALAADLMDHHHRAGRIAMERLKVPETWSKAGQIDVATLDLSWTQPKPTAYEVKISRADFLGDIRAGKWRRYLGYVERIYFAVPKDLVHKKEIPPEAGLMFRGPKGWYSVKAPQPNVLKGPPPQVNRLVMALLFRHYGTGWDGAMTTRRNVHVKLRENGEAGLPEHRKIPGLLTWE